MEYKNLLDSYYSDIFISLKNPTDVFKKFKEAH